jgi:hypothetical protein
MSDLSLILIPCSAIISRLLIVARFKSMRNLVPTEAELDREGNRATILPLAGFSFTALLALVVLDASKVIGLRVSVLLLLLSFLGYYLSFNLQSYKARRWQDQLATALKEAASGWLLLSVVGVIQQAPASTLFKLSISLIALSVWLVDLAIRVVIDFRVYRDLSKL